MSWYLIIKTLHIISSTVLFGTGIGIAFFMFRSAFTNNLQRKFYAAQNTVLADTLFTLPSGIIQLITGLWLLEYGGFNIEQRWLLYSIVLFALAGLCWLPVVWIQLKLRDHIRECIIEDTELPPRYHKLFKIWFTLGWPAFAALMIIFYCMVAKPL